MTHVEDYQPSTGQGQKSRNLIANFDIDALDLKGLTPGKSTDKAATFKKKLGAKSGDQSYSVDYDSLFSSQSGKAAGEAPAPTLPRNLLAAGDNHYPVPLIAADIKAHNTPTLKCELSVEEASSLRENFLKDRNSKIMIGFEVLSVIFRHSGKLKAFKLPLYYMDAAVTESGRNLHIACEPNGSFYLNHLGITEVIERFAQDNRDELLQKFFQNLSSQKIELGKQLHNFRIHRHLPASTELFSAAREILIGKQGEEGRGGLLEGLNILGIECDLDAVVLYKTPVNPSPLIRALEKDLGETRRISKESPQRFYSSVLGQFLNSERRLLSDQSAVEPYAETFFAPGFPTKSTRRLIDKLNTNNLVLLEGPPGTGKTFTILNLLLHSISAGQRILIVSDQKAAIHALTEKLEEYLVGRDFTSPRSKAQMSLLKSAVKVIDEIPLPEDNLNQWVTKLAKMLGLSQSNHLEEAASVTESEAAITAIDLEIAEARKKLELILDRNWGKTDRPRTSPKHFHPTTIEEISDFISFAKFLGAGSHLSSQRSDAYQEKRVLTQIFIADREVLATDDLVDCYRDFTASKDLAEEIRVADQHVVVLQNLCAGKVKTRQRFDDIIVDLPEQASKDQLRVAWLAHFKGEQGLLDKIKTTVKHPCLELWQDLLRLWRNRRVWLEYMQSLENAGGIIAQFQQIHESLDPNDSFKNQCPALELAGFSLSENGPEKSIQDELVAMERLWQQRDEAARGLMLARLAQITTKALDSGKQATDAITVIQNSLAALKDCTSIDATSGLAILGELQESLASTFPIWICRKQAASFIFPTRERQFDLVIVDEAGQCRVDDALPLLFRGSKVLVVGDDKQTVMDKNSIVDDYLFKDFELDEQLRALQAWGVKGGGSNLFAMVKSVKEAAVLLDEHYRCPPAIISYSNEYVYNSDLKIMQWQRAGSLPAVKVDYSEKSQTLMAKPTKGKFKGIETHMIDRYLRWVAKTIKDIEKETGRPINMETDVALCYFLLKNEVYVKEMKHSFLQALGRGHDVLDGAGAALQGKERDYIFYLWDINRYNFSFFKQGDDPDKRKGELNVLMSRPKKRAYHFLHQSFDSLKHDQASITDYLWKTYVTQGEREAKKIWTPRTTKPDPKKLAWQRGSGQSFQAILSHLWQDRSDLLADFKAHYSVVLGDPQQKNRFNPQQAGRLSG